MPQTGELRKIRSTYRRQLLTCVRADQDISVAELSEKTRLSKPTIMKLLAHYVERGLVISVGKGSPSAIGGKPPSLYRLNAKAGFVLAFHIFPDELFCVATDLNETDLRECSAPLSEKEGAAETVAKMALLYQEQLRELSIPPVKLIGVAIGAHGVTDSTHGVVVTSPHFPLWGENIPLRQMFQEATGFRGSIVVDNQIRFQVYAEKARGVAQNRKNIIAVEAGIGLVAGIIVKDEIKRGVHFLAGEIGHMVLCPSDEERCPCGGRGCFEVMVSTKRIMRRMRDGAERHPSSALFTRYGADQIVVEDLFRESNQGDAFAMLVMEETARWFAIGLWNLILAYDPEIVVIQGTYAKAGAFFLERLRLLINEVSLPKVPRNVEIMYSTFQKQRCAIGASALMVKDYLASQAVGG